MVFWSVIQEANFLRQFYQNMKRDQVEINIYVDNQSGIELAKNPIHQRPKHSDVKYHYISSEFEFCLMPYQHLWVI